MATEERRLRIGDRLYTYADIIEHAEDIVHRHSQTGVEHGLAIVLLAVIRDLEETLGTRVAD